MAAHKPPTFTELSPEEAIGLLARNHVGRIAFTFHDRVDIEPISYVYDDGWIYARTSPGTKLTTLFHQPWVAFEVDEARGHLDWSSVVVRGGIHFFDPNDTDRAAFADALDKLHRVDPTAITPDDDTPTRRVVFRIHADEITGRRASTHT